MIKPKYLKQINDSRKCKALLQIALDKSELTINRYVNDNDIMLTTSAALSVIRDFTGVTVDELLEPAEIKK